MPDFSHPTKIDNEFFPLEPGRSGLQGDGHRGRREYRPRGHLHGQHAHQGHRRCEGPGWSGTGTSATGELEEVELAFFAQDDKGRVWNFGEYPEEFANGKFDGAPNVWITGLDGARGGIHMLADPEVGDAYVEGLVRKIDFYDVSKWRRKA